MLSKSMCLAVVAVGVALMTITAIVAKANYDAGSIAGAVILWICLGAQGVVVGFNLFLLGSHRGK